MIAAHSPPEAADPLIALWTERSRVAAHLHALRDDDGDRASARLIETLVRIDDRIAAAVPLSAAGAIVQLRLLREHFDGDSFAEKIIDNLIAALRRGRRDVLLS